MDNADIDVKFSDVLPQETESLIRSLSIARGGEAIMSEETAVRMNPLVPDSETEIEKLAGDNARLQSLAGSYGV